MLSRYDPNTESEPPTDLLKLLLTYALDLVETMNNSDGIYRQPTPQRPQSRGRVLSASRHDDTRTRINTTVRKDLMAPFKASKKYAFYWRLK